MTQSYLRNPSIERLPAILEELHSGSLCIPPFQRDFEWTGEQRLALCGSVQLGLPTGSLMVWRTTRELEVENPIGPYLLNRTEVAARQYLLDGRQRITTLYSALGMAFWTREGKEPARPNPDAESAPDGTSWWICYDLTNGAFVLNGDRSPKPPERPEKPNSANQSTPILLPLSVLFDDTAYDDWRGQAQLSRELANRARSVRSAFMDYQIPIVPLVTDDIGVVTLTFKRVNNGGTPMGDADMARALAWSETFDLRSHIDAAKEELKPRGWGEVEDEALLKVVAVVAGLEPIEVDPEDLANRLKVEPSLVALAGRRIDGAAAFLAARIGILGPATLPYTQILVFVARAIHEAGGELSAGPQQKLAGWIAEVCIDERFGAAPHNVVRAIWRGLANQLQLPSAEPSGGRNEKNIHASECRRFSMRWARSRGTALVLSSKGPRDGNNEPIVAPGVLIANEPDGIGRLVAAGAEGLPPELLARATKQKNLATALRSPANRFVCPPAQLPALRQTLLQSNCPPLILTSHLIDSEAHAKLLSGDLLGFFERRRQAILDAEKRWVEAHGGKVELIPQNRTYEQG